MIKIELKEFMGTALCKSELYSSKESFMPLTYDFLGGNVYGLISDFGRGSWGLTTCLGGRGDIMNGSVHLNEKQIELKNLADLSCFVGESNVSELEMIDSSVSAKSCIEKALLASRLQFTIQDIKGLFGLSDERFERDLKLVSGEIWRISAAIGFARNKQIFCYPWLNTHEASVCLDKAILDVLRKNQKIILIPACRTFMKSPYKNILDQIIDFHAYEKPYFTISSEERKKLKKRREWW